MPVAVQNSNFDAASLLDTYSSRQASCSISVNPLQTDVLHLFEERENNSDPAVNTPNLVFLAT
jgi:hypothetical protein